MSAKSTEATGNRGRNAASTFVLMALEMSWKLALVVLLPVIGGFKLDQKFNSSPSFTVAGFVLAMLGMGLVLWQTLQAANRLPVPKLTAAEKRAVKRSYEEEDKDA